MRDVKKILEMRSQNFSQRKIAEALKVSRDTVRKVSKAADENNICWSMIQNQNEMEVQKLLFGKETKLNLIINNLIISIIKILARLLSLSCQNEEDKSRANILIILIIRLLCKIVNK